MGQDASADRINARQLWQAYDLDQNGQLSRAEVEKLLQSILRHYGAEFRMNAAFVDGVMKELDVNGNGVIEQDEFESLFEELWTHHSELFRSRGQRTQPSAMSAATRPNAPMVAYSFPQVRPAEIPSGSAAINAAPMLHCPHCAFEIDPTDLERLRVSPELLSACHEAWDSQLASMPSVGSVTTASHGLPPGTQAWGQVPPSFFNASSGGWSHLSSRQMGRG
mmetsp:Transcript_37870/g.85324  ORF Transcript_37870/g.85324 Transcript_37870/m.85324 type:complete len:222 (+) Transcript_37870:75-740(+)|eukprot:6258528-Amphidinium_carterae.1